MPCPTEVPCPPPWRRAGAGIAALLLAAGCIQAPPPPAASAPAPVEVPAASPPPPPPAPQATALQRLADFHERSKALGPTELAREQARLAATPGAEATLQLAWLLAQARSPGDLARAQTLLEPLARGEGPASMLAQLLLARLADQRRLDDQLERAAQQQRDLQKRNEQLREQLDALRAIERSLGPRPAASAPKSP